MTPRHLSLVPLVLRCALGACFVLPFALAAAEPPAPAAILEDLKAFATMGTVLHIAAHPDDENTQAITYLAKGRHFRTAYLSTTRGDGGQNEIGPEFDAELGVARTQELLAARRIDGGRQFFTRAMDFGYSKTVEEALRIWERDQVLGDVVRVIRTFRPDVIFTASSPLQTPGNHGHHVAAAVLGVEAFKIAGDPKAYPEQLADGLTVWQPKRILQGSGGINATGTDPVTGETFAALSGRSRAMHYTQFGIPGTNARGGGGGGARGGAAPAGGAPGAAPGGGRAAGAAPAGGAPGGGAPAGGRGAGGGGRGGGGIMVLAGDPATTDLMEGVDTTWARVSGGAEIGRLADEAIANFKTDNPSASVTALLAIKTQLARLPADIILDEKRQQLDRIIAGCLGLTVETLLGGSLQPGEPAGSSIASPASASNRIYAEVVPGEAFTVYHTATVRSDVPVKWVATRYPTLPSETSLPQSALAMVRDGKPGFGQSLRLPANTRISQPYWLREPARPGLFTVQDGDRKLIGQPENPSVLPVNFVFEVGGQTIVIPTEPYQNGTGDTGPQRRRRLDVIPPVIVHFPTLTKVFAPGGTKPVEVELTANRANTNGTVQLDLPAGWTATPATQNFRIAASGGKQTVSFTVRAAATGGTANLGAHATVGGQRYATDRVAIDYKHLPYQLLQPTAGLKAVTTNLAIKGSRVGYFAGAGDDVPDTIAQMGYTVTQITGADLNAEKLKAFDAVVLGVRAFDEKPELSANFDALLAWVEAGGTVIAQYNRAGGSPRFGPYPLNFAGGAPARRTTDENAPVTFLAPDHPALTTPNRIGPDDFLNWVQERGTYYPSDWDQQKYTALFAMNDPGEAPINGSLLVAQHGKGYYVYSGVAFFRQLPKGVPGAYRLFANLLSLGK